MRMTEWNDRAAQRRAEFGPARVIYAVSSYIEGLDYSWVI